MGDRMELKIGQWTTIDERTWCYDEGGVRFFLLAGSERALLLDRTCVRAMRATWPRS